MIVSARSEAANLTDGLAVRVNSDTGSNYSATYIRGDGTSAISSRTSNDTYYRFSVDAVVGGNAASGTFSATSINFMNYANSTTYKTILGRSNVAAGGADATVGLWRSTSAITSIQCVGFGGNLFTGSTFSLYGILAA